jgi:benzoate/toluate 1,2-dioxygenase beta subunit
MTAAPDARAIEQFLFHEARLLDEQRFEDWGALFTEDGEYWMPVSAGQPDPLNHVSLLYETKLLRDIHIRRFREPNAFSPRLPARTSHAVHNVMIDAHDAATGRVDVSARFVVGEFARGEVRTYQGAYHYWLLPSPDGYRIRRKRVDLINSEGALTDIHVYL